MIETSDIFFVWAESPLHAGSGSSVGAVDLPIQRERQTGHPILQSTGVKGVFRDHCRQAWNVREDQDSKERKCLWAIFGPKGSNASDYGGAASFSDARLLLFPVRSLRGVYAWITCPLALARFARDLERVGQTVPDLPVWNGEVPGEGIAWVTPGSPISLEENNQISALVLEEYTLVARHNAAVAQAAKWLSQNALPTSDAYKFWKNRLYSETNHKSHLAIVSDDDFKEFVEHTTDVAQRISVNPDTGTVKDTGLWTEESLPADSLLYTVLHVLPPRSNDRTPADLTENGLPSAAKAQAVFQKAVADKPLVQMGGNETVGRGLTRVRRLAAPPKE